MEAMVDTAAQAFWLPVLGHRRLDPEFVRAARIGALVVFWVLAISTAQAAVRGYVLGDDSFVVNASLGVDAHAYWVAGGSSHPYDQAPGVQDAFLDSPVFAQLMRPLSLLPFGVFLGLWMAVEASLFAWLVAPLPKKWAIPLFLLCVPELLLGNVVGLIATAAVLGVTRLPEAWSFPLLTKITPGVLGLAWFLVRGEWRNLARAVAFTLAVVAVSYAVSPSLWRDWFTFLTQQSRAGGGPGALARAGLALALVVAGARNGRAWVLGPALLVCTPVLGGVNAIAMLTAVPRLVGASTPLARPWWLSRRHRDVGSAAHD
jgi:hypothetical protein